MIKQARKPTLFHTHPFVFFQKLYVLTRDELLNIYLLAPQLQIWKPNDILRSSRVTAKRFNSSCNIYLLIFSFFLVFNSINSSLHCKKCFEIWYMINKISFITSQFQNLPKVWDFFRLYVSNPLRIFYLF